MPKPPAPASPVEEKDVLAPSARGTAYLQGTGTSLTADQLALLVLVDGRATVAQIARSARPRSIEVVREALGKLLAAGLIERARAGASDMIEAGDFFSITAPLELSAAAPGGPELAQGVASLQAKGYYVRIARRPSEERKRPEGRKPVVLIIDDDAHLAKLLQTCFKLEGFASRVAANREQIVAAFREPAAPELVLLDVVLPDVDGFDVLWRMRQHPLLKAVPVIMLTGKSTREAVLKGLQGGADGYITKPFEVDVLMDAVKTVLGPAAD